MASPIGTERFYRRKSTDDVWQGMQLSMKQTNETEKEIANVRMFYENLKTIKIDFELSLMQHTSLQTASIRWGSLSFDVLINSLKTVLPLCFIDQVMFDSSLESTYLV